MLSKALFSLSLLGFVASFSAFGDEVVPPSPTAGPVAPSQSAQISIAARADEVKEVKIISDDKKTATVYAVEKVDERLVDGTLLKNPDSEETKKIREEIKASIIANGQPIETFKLKKGEYEKLQSESQWFWNRWARRAWRRGYYGYGGYYGGGYCYSAPVYYAPPVVYTQPIYYAQPVCYDPCYYNYGFYGYGGGYGVFIG